MLTILLSSAPLPFPSRCTNEPNYFPFFAVFRLPFHFHNMFFSLLEDYMFLCPLNSFSNLQCQKQVFKYLWLKKKPGLWGGLLPHCFPTLAPYLMQSLFCFSSSSFKTLNSMNIFKLVEVPRKFYLAGRTHSNVKLSTQFPSSTKWPQALLEQSWHLAFVWLQLSTWVIPSSHLPGLLGPVWSGFQTRP